MRGLIVAVSPEGVIGKDGAIPWRHPGDQRRFKRVTLGSAVVMGRKTWESLGGKPLVGRRNVVLTHRALPGVETYADVASALRALAADADVWFIGGARVYADAMPYCDLLDVTYVPDHVEGGGLVTFPAIDDAEFEAGPLLPHEDEAGLTRRVYTRRARSS